MLAERSIYTQDRKESLSASQVSEINKGLDDMVEEFRNRKLDKEYPVIR